MPKDNPDIVTDLLEWEYNQFPPKHFKVIAASVPCAQYSVAKTTAPRDLPRADALVCRVLEIVKYFQPKTWWIENPQTGLLKERPMMKDIPYVDIDYCQFSDWGYKKPTRFWGSNNIGKLPSVRCPGRQCKNVVIQDDGYRHKEKLGGNHMKFGTALKGRIPARMVDYLLQEGEFAKMTPRKNIRKQKDKGYKMCPKLRQETLRKLKLDPKKNQVGCLCESQ